MLEFDRPVAAVCHDAGGANIILAWLLADGGRGWRVHLAGPAAALAAGRLGDATECATVERALDGAAMLVSGTGWASDVEHAARVAARRRRMRSVAVLDHWVNYRARFERNGEIVMPDELWVTDEFALAEARRTFPDIVMREVPNPYMQAQVAALGSVPAATSADLVYVLEPARSDWGRGRPGEFQALDYFFAHFDTLRVPHGTPVRLRPHPSDPPGKYDGWLGTVGGSVVTLDSSRDLASCLRTARWVVGCESVALVVALLAGRDVICSLPPWAPSCRLPHDGLVHLKSLVPEGGQDQKA
jgi:hypothetical protein